VKQEDQGKTSRFIGLERLKRYPSAPLTTWLMMMAGWLLILVATLIGLWTVEPGIFPFLASLGILAQLGATISALSLEWSTRRILVTSAAVFAFTWFVEYIGVSSGVPFGKYSYSLVLQPQISGVPALIPLAWMMMLVPAWGIAQAILGGKRGRLKGWYWLIFAVVSGAAFTAWDLYLDPQMVAREMWAWEHTGGVTYFGIPWANYLGWWLTSSLITLIIRPGNLPVLPLLAIYAMTWIFQAIGLGFFWGLPGPALAGFVAMGLFVLLAFLSIRTGSST
jgi:putative membrane protein